MGASGINALVAVSTLKAGLASDEAADAANKARDLVIKQKDVRARQAAFERIVSDKTMTQDEYASLNAMLGEVGMKKDGVDYSYDGVLGYTDSEGKWSAKIDAGDDKDATSRDNATKVENMRKSFDGELKDLEAQDRMDNFTIQDLMSRYNQAETLASSIDKKKSDTESGVIQKIG